MGFESVAEGEVGRTTVKFGTIIENACFRHVIAVTAEEGSRSIGLAGAGHCACFGVDSTWIGDYGRDAAKAVSWVAVGAAIAAAERSGPQIEIERVVVFGNVGIAAAQGEPSAHPLVEAKNSSVVLA